MSRFKNKFRFGLDRFQQTLYLVKYPSIGTIETNAGEKLPDGQLGGSTADKTLKMKKKTACTVQPKGPHLKWSEEKISKNINFSL